MERERRACVEEGEAMRVDVGWGVGVGGGMVGVGDCGWFGG